MWLEVLHGPTRSPVFRKCSGRFFVDSGCIDCGACQRLAPATFDEREGKVRVFRQPEDPAVLDKALMALITCPVSAIGTIGRHDLRPAACRFPERIDGPVFDCGYASPKSFGATSYLIVRPGGNIPVDSPGTRGPSSSAWKSWAGSPFFS